MLASAQRKQTNADWYALNCGNCTDFVKASQATSKIISCFESPHSSSWGSDYNLKDAVMGLSMIYSDVVSTR